MDTSESKSSKVVTDFQLEILSQIGQRELVEAFDKLLHDRGLPLRIRSVEFDQLPISPAAEPIMAQSTTPPDFLPPPPGGAYSCWWELDYNVWVCECLEPQGTAGPH